MPVIVKTQVLALLPPLEQAPDQIASRSPATLSVIAVFAANGAVPLLPTLTLMPAGLDVTVSPLRPVAVTVNVTLVLGGFSASTAVRVTPAKAAVMVAVVAAVTAVLIAVNVALLAPAATVTLAGTPAAAVLLLVSATTAPPAAAALVSVTVPVEELPPVTLLGLSASVFRLAGGGTGVTVSVAVRLTPL